MKLSRSWGQLGKIQDPRKNSTPTMAVGTIEARATLKSACGGGVLKMEAQKILFPLPRYVF